MERLAGPKHNYLYAQVAVYSSFGGPAKPDNADPAHPATPTRPGRFIINYIGPHTTMNTGKDAYLFSAVPWNTPLRLYNRKIIQIKLGAQDWQPLTNLLAWRRYERAQPLVTGLLIREYEVA